jgi:HSP20 family molecular chaperone IbpA
VILVKRSRGRATRRSGTVVVKAEMPGIESGKIEVTISDGELRISGERSGEKEV